MWGAVCPDLCHELYSALGTSACGGVSSGSPRWEDGSAEITHGCRDSGRPSPQESPTNPCYQHPLQGLGAACLASTEAAVGGSPVHLAGGGPGAEVWVSLCRMRAPPYPLLPCTPVSGPVLPSAPMAPPGFGVRHGEQTGWPRRELYSVAGFGVVATGPPARRLGLSSPGGAPAGGRERAQSTAPTSSPGRLPGWRGRGGRGLSSGWGSAPAGRGGQGSPSCPDTAFLGRGRG